jgi:hypothetical protein
MATFNRDIGFTRSRVIIFSISPCSHLLRKQDHGEFHSNIADILGLEQGENRSPIKPPAQEKQSRVRANGRVGKLIALRSKDSAKLRIHRREF